MAKTDLTNSSYRVALLTGIELLEALIAEADAIDAIPADTPVAREFTIISAAGRPARKIAKKLAAADRSCAIVVGDLAEMAARLAA
ncbi:MULTISPECIES: hypothetical protein [unclassified Devosia]|uniref:hypothetical protein n=1 Tax=unclassified Devosia TaxID=196773 RepID=UPI001ACCA4FE|nr:MULTISPECIES: hypothetical protein [unclassified Devosia]MBN9306832.1 hypothetical protein [Devosia sp.]